VSRTPEQLMNRLLNHVQRGDLLTEQQQLERELDALNTRISEAGGWEAMPVAEKAEVAQERARLFLAIRDFVAGAGRG
jgi:hypothetical protein